MGDTTSLFVVELYHYFLWTNDTELLDQLWPPAKRAASWSISEATKGRSKLCEMRRSLYFTLLYG